MANQLPDSFRQCLQDSQQHFPVKLACRGNAYSTIRRAHSFLLERAAKLRSEHLESCHSGGAKPQSWSGQHCSMRPCPEWFIGISYCLDPTSLRRSQNRPQDMREHMRVLVAVHVGKSDSPRLDFADLSFGLLLNLVGGNLPAYRS